ncbi:glutamic-type intramembrane protease PrsW [Oceanobacillus luteolus]|uniref:Protease PrsW n=1 Tax=Oceanobacillus luteolus TaxID=1274358 RepID=A0ABW4HUH8_9BACI
MIAIFTVGFAPVVALMSFFYLKDEYQEPIPLIIRCFLLGSVLVFPIMFVQHAFVKEGFVLNSFLESFLQIALLEEFLKWFIFMFSMYHHEEFDDHYDGIVYATAISLGFASVENILFLLTNGIEYGFSRAIFPVSSHALFGVIMGYYIGKAKTRESRTKYNLWLAFFIPFLLHGIYNYILQTVTTNWLYYLIPFMIVLWMFGLHRMKVANQPNLN